MKTIFLHTRIITIILSVSILFFACRKETSQDNLTDQEEEQASVATSESEASSEIIFNEVFDNVIGVNNDVGLAGTGVFGRFATNNTFTETARIMGCYIVSITSLVQGQTFPLRVEIDFGSGCAGKMAAFGRARLLPNIRDGYWCQAPWQQPCFRTIL